MTTYKQVLAVLVALGPPALAQAGPTLYDLQHSTVLRQRLPPYLRDAPVDGPSLMGADRKRADETRKGADAGAAKPGADGSDPSTDGKSKKQ